MNLLRKFVAVALILGSACTNRAPECRITGDSDSTLVGNAGCLIVDRGQLLAVYTNRESAWNFPGGGAKPGESAACTAHRETWEETGLDIQVGRLAHRFDNGFVLFACHLDQPWDGTYRSTMEVERVGRIDPMTLPDEQWRYPEQMGLVRALFQTLVARGS